MVAKRLWWRCPFSIGFEPVQPCTLCENLVEIRLAILKIECPQTLKKKFFLCGNNGDNKIIEKCWWPVVQCDKLKTLQMIEIVCTCLLYTQFCERIWCSDRDVCDWCLWIMFILIVSCSILSVIHIMIPEHHCHWVGKEILLGSSFVFQKEIFLMLWQVQ